MLKLLSPQQIGILAAVMGGVFVLGLLIGFGSGWTAQGWRKDAVIAERDTSRAEAVAQAERDARTQYEQQQEQIGGLNADLINAQKELAEAHRTQPRVDRISLCVESPKGVPQGAGPAAPAGTARPPAEANPLGGTHAGTATASTRGIYALTDEGDRCLVREAGWRDYARAIGAIP